MKIGIYALGLIGGSLLKALYGNKHYLTAVTRNEESLASAKQWADKVSSDINDLCDCEIVFVCTPMNKTEKVLDILESILSADTIVADVCSLKSFICSKKRSYIFIGSHPMAGTENSGFNASFSTLFQGAKWVLTPTEDISLSSISKLEFVINQTGANIITMEPEEHDKSVAVISHMPLLLSHALMNVAKTDEKAIKLAAGGFRDMTRLSMSNIEMTNDMFNLNKDNIRKALESLKQTADYMLENIPLEEMSAISAFRSSMYNSNGINEL